MCYEAAELGLSEEVRAAAALDLLRGDVLVGAGPADDDAEGEDQRAGDSDERLAGAFQRVADLRDQLVVQLRGAEQVAAVDEVVAEGQVDDAVRTLRRLGCQVDVVEAARTTSVPAAVRPRPRRNGPGR